MQCYGKSAPAAFESAFCAGVLLHNPPPKKKTWWFSIAFPGSKHYLNIHYHLNARLTLGHNLNLLWTPDVFLTSFDGWKEGTAHNPTLQCAAPWSNAGSEVLAVQEWSVQLANLHGRAKWHLPQSLGLQCLSAWCITMYPKALSQTHVDGKNHTLFLGRSLQFKC